MDAIFQKRLLTEQEFFDHVSPDDNMTYGEIRKNIFGNQKYNASSLFFTDISEMLIFEAFRKKEKIPKRVDLLDFSVSSKKIQKDIKNMKSFYDCSPYLLHHFIAAYDLYKENIKRSFADFHIVAANYSTYLFFKLSFLKNAHLWYLSSLDKYVMLLAKFFNIDTRKKRTFQMLECICCKKEEIGNDVKRFYTGKRYKGTRNVANNIKHNEDEITKVFLNYVLVRDLSKEDLESIEKKFYADWIQSLYKAMEDFVEMVNRHFSLLQKNP